MIEAYVWSTGNGRKVLIALEELGLAYRVCPVDITAGAQFEPSFVAINPNAKIPAIIDRRGHVPVPVFESGAILLHLAETTGRLLPVEPVARLAVIQWVFWQAAGFGPMLGQAHHFNRRAPAGNDYARSRYSTEARRLYGVLDRQLEGQDYVTGGFSIADIMIFPWVQRHDWQGIDLAEFPAVEDWFRRVEHRPAVAAAMAVAI
jgi:GSH-dependent disulfide-bond oxidoreductase